MGMPSGVVTKKGFLPRSFSVHPNTADPGDPVLPGLSAHHHLLLQQVDGDFRRAALEPDTYTILLKAKEFSAGFSRGFVDKAVEGGSKSRMPCQAEPQSLDDVS